MEEVSYLRNAVVGVNIRVPIINGRYRTAINFDNAATTPPFHSVMREIGDFAPWYSSVHRGTGYKSIFTSNIYEQGRDIIKQFVGADQQRDVVIFTKSTTEAINLLAYKLSCEDPDQIVLSTDMEHLANDLPWRYSCKTDFIGIDNGGRLSIREVEEKLVMYKGRVKLVAVTGASNVTGYINPIHDIARIAHKYGAKILVDGAQLVPHCPVDMRPFGSPEHIDYLAFSAHKMYAPFGAGVLIGPQETFQKGIPACKGGGAVNLVTRQFVDWADSPGKDEAGSPNVMGIIALTTAIRTLNSLDMTRLHKHETHLIQYAMDGLRSISGINLYGDSGKEEQRVSLVSFSTPGIHHRTVAKILSCEAGIAVRSGLFCAHPYVQKLLGLTEKDLQYCHDHLDAELPGVVRISFGLYNTCREIDKFIDVLTWIMRNKSQLIEKYKDVERWATYPWWMLKPLRKETP